MKHLQILQNNVENLYKKRYETLDLSLAEILLSKVVLLDTELSEFMNEIEDHKLYKLNKKSNRVDQTSELCDCIHVICSIANMLDIKLKGYEEYIYHATKDESVMWLYKKTKVKINSINIGRALDNKEYITFALEEILRYVLEIARLKDFTQAEIVTGFVAVYTKNMIRAKSDY